jgi:hypothetical protein
MVMNNSQGGGLGGLSPSIKRHLELEIRTRKRSKTCRQVKTAFESKGKGKAGSNAHCRDIRRLVTEIEMLRLYCIWWRGAEEYRILLPISGKRSFKSCHYVYHQSRKGSNPPSIAFGKCRLLYYLDLK